jgi:hypothetical protein
MVGLSHNFLWLHPQLSFDISKRSWNISVYPVCVAVSGTVPITMRWMLIFVFILRLGGCAHPQLKPHPVLKSMVTFLMVTLEDLPVVAVLFYTLADIICDGFCRVASRAFDTGQINASIIMIW